MGFESLYGLFSLVSLVVIWWDKLELHVVLRDCSLELFGTFVVEYVSFRLDS